MPVSESARNVCRDGDAEATLVAVAPTRSTGRPTPPGDLNAEIDDATRRKVMLIGSLGSAVSAFDLSLMFVVYPAIRAAFPDEPLAKISFVLTSYTIVAAALLIPAGRLADRFGRSRTYTLGISLFAIGTTAAAVSPNVTFLIAARVVQAVGGAFITPSSIGLVLSVFPPERRSAALGIWSSVNSALTTTAPVLGSLVIRAGSWRYAFLLSVLPAVFCLVMARRSLVAEVIDRSQPIPDPLGSIMIAVALAALAYAIVKTNTWGWTDGKTIGVLAVPVAITPLFLWRCRHHRAPVVDLDVVRQSAGFRGMAIYAITIGVLYWGAYYVLVQFLTRGWHYSIVATGLRLVPISIPALLLGRLLGRLLDRHGFKRVIIPAAVTYGVTMVAVALVSTSRATMVFWIPAGLMIGLCTNTLFIGANTAGAASAPVESLGMMTALVQTLIRIGGVTGSALAVSIVGDASSAATPSFRGPFLAIAALAVPTVAATLLLRERPAHVRPET